MMAQGYFCLSFPREQMASGAFFLNSAPYPRAVAFGALLHTCVSPARVAAGITARGGDMSNPAARPEQSGSACSICVNNPGPAGGARASSELSSAPSPPEIRISAAHADLRRMDRPQAEKPPESPGSHSPAAGCRSRHGPRQSSVPCDGFSSAATRLLP